MNPWLTLNDCDKKINEGLRSEKDKKFFCISTQKMSSSPSTTSSIPTKTSSKTTSTSKVTTTILSGVTPPAPTQAGVAKNCNKWHTVVKDDGCWAISNKYSITLDNFYKFNPDVGNDCKNLWLGYAVCIEVSGSR